MFEQSMGRPGLTVSQMTAQLSAAYIALIRSGMPMKRFPSVMLWGPPGVGKSQGVRQIAQRIAEKTGKRVEITDVRLLLFNPVDLRGIPTANADKTLAVWLKPKIFQMDEGEDVVNILFLDEISAAPQSVQAAAYQITLDRTAGEHRLPPNCIVIAAGNRVTDRSVAYTMPRALANRLCHIDVTADHGSWHEWAVGAGIHSAILGFLDAHPAMLAPPEGGTDSLAFPTPRSWEMASQILSCVSQDVGQVFPLIAGCVGDQAAYELRNWCEIYKKLPDVKAIFAGEAAGIPVRPEAMFALSAQMAEYARSHHDDDEIEHAVAYAARLPVEFRNRVFEDLLQIKEARRRLSRIYAYNDWFARSGRYWEDYGV